MAGPGDVIVFGVILQRERDEQVIIKNLHVERRIAGRQVRIGKALHLLEVVVEDVDRAIAEIGREKEGAVVIVADCQPLVDGALASIEIVNGEHRTAGVHGRIPAGDRAILGRENEHRRGRYAIVRNFEITRWIEHLPGPAGRAIRRRRLSLRNCDRNYRKAGDGYPSSGTVIDCGHPFAVIRYPQGPGRAKGTPPWVFKLWIATHSSNQPLHT